jgi:hypothetical protein
LGVALAFAFAWAPVPAAAQQPVQRVERPHFVPGESWTYRRVDLWRNEETERWRQTVTAVLGTNVTLLWEVLSSKDARRAGGRSQEYLDAAHGGLYNHLVTEGRHQPLAFPLEPGRSWRFQYRLTTEGGREVTVRQEARAERWEQVQVPAGSFRALRISHRGEYHSTEAGASWSGQIRETYWYAPAVKRVVRTEYRDTQPDGHTWDQWRDELVGVELSKGGSR